MYLLILLTFITGFVGGAVLYLETRSTAEPNKTIIAEPDFKIGFEIIGYRYGGCERLGCPSYRIADDGSYTYLTQTREGEDMRYEDTISEKRVGELALAVYAIDFDEIYDHGYTGTCPADYDGIAYRYEIERDGERFSIDSCREDIRTEALFMILADYFEIFSVTHRNE